MLPKLNFLHLIIYALHMAYALEDLPPYFPRCHRTDPEMEKCLIAATEEVRPYIRKGVPDFLPAIENFTVPELVVEQGTRAINYKAVLNNLTLMGLEDYNFTRYYFDNNNMSFTLEVQLSQLFLKGKYALSGNLFFASIRGNGDFSANITDSVCSVYHTVEIVNKNGLDYIRPGITIPKMRIGKVVDYVFTGLFSNNKQIEDLTNIIIKNNLDVIVEEITPAIEKTLSAIFDRIIFKSVTKIPFDKLYPK